MVVISYLEIEPLKLDLQTKKILNLKSLVPSEIHKKKKKKRKNLESRMGDLPRTYQRTQIDRALPGSVARGLDRAENRT